MIYEYRCNKCREITAHNRPMALRKDPAECGLCGGEAHHIVSPTRSNAVMGAADNPGYVSPMSGNWIDSQKARREEMQKYDVVERG